MDGELIGTMFSTSCVIADQFSIYFYSQWTLLRLQSCKVCASVDTRIENAISLKFIQSLHIHASIIHSLPIILSLFVCQ